MAIQPPQRPSPSRPAAQGDSEVLAQPTDEAGVFKLVQEQISPVLDALEKIIGKKLIAYFLDEGAALADEQMHHLYEHLRRIGKQKDLGLWISSRGGATEVPWKIVSLIREFSERFSVLVPYRAHSAATHIALGADEIVMTEMSELGPVDPSRRHPLLPREDTPSGERAQIPISVQDLRHVLDFLKREIGKDLPPEAAAQVYTALFDKVHPLAIGALEQSYALSQQITERVLSTHMDGNNDREAINALVERFSDYYKSHLYPISRREAHGFGLKVKDASPQEARAMWDLYLAYTRLQISGEGKFGREAVTLVRLGHIDTTVGLTVGLGFAKASEPQKPLGARWQSQWLAEPA